MSEPPQSRANALSRWWPWMIVAILALYAASLLRDIDLPWIGMHDWNGAFYSYTARNLLRYPALLTHLLPVAEMGPNAPATVDPASRYASHPPGQAWLLAGVFAALGVHEWSARLVPIAASLGSLWLLIRITGAARGRAVALLAGLMYAVMPMTTFFGRMVNHEAVCLFFMLLAWWGWFAWHGEIATRRSDRFCMIAWMVASAAAIWIDWPGVLASGTILIDASRRCAQQRVLIRRCVLAAVVPAVATLGVFSFLVYAGMIGSWPALRDMFFSRAVAAAPPGTPARRDTAAVGTPRDYIVQNCSVPVLVLAAIGLISFGVARRRRSVDVEPRRLISPLVMMLGVGGTWLAMFWPQFERHNYWQFYLGPPSAILAAEGVMWLYALLRPGLGAVAMVPVFLIAAVVVKYGIEGTNDYFQRRSYPADVIEAWREMGGMLDRDEQVLMSQGFLNIDRRGAYSFRNIVPPQLAYYLDRTAVAYRPHLESGVATGTAVNYSCSVWMCVDTGEAPLSYFPGLKSDCPIYRLGRFFVADLRPERKRRMDVLLVPPRP